MLVRLACCSPTYTKAQQKKWHTKKVMSSSFKKRMSERLVDEVMISSIASLSRPAWIESSECEERERVGEWVSDRVGEWVERLSK